MDNINSRDSGYRFIVSFNGKKAGIKCFTTVEELLSSCSLDVVLR